MYITRNSLQNTANCVMDIIERTLINFYNQWQNEKTESNFQKYLTDIQFILSDYPVHGISVEKMTKKPFGFIWNFSGHKFHTTINKNYFKTKSISR